VDESDKPALRQLAAALDGAAEVAVSIDDGEPLQLPQSALRVLNRALAVAVAADFVQIQPLDSLLTTQEAADFLGVSRPTLIKLLGEQEGQLRFERPGPGQSHRRLRLEDVVAYRDQRATAVAERGIPKLLERRRALSAERRSPAPSASGAPQPSHPSPMRRRIVTNINGKTYAGEVEPRLLLVHYLRDELRLTGTHVGCDTSQCGACTILVGGRAIKSCTMFAVQADGLELTTIEGLAKDGTLHPIQQAFWDEHGLQCGFCTPGFIMAATELLWTNPNPTDEEIRRGLEGNLCRCTGYVNIIKAVKSAAKAMGGATAAKQYVSQGSRFSR